MKKRVVIIGAVALGPKVAVRVKRLDPTIHVTLIDRDSVISYGGCGIPYYVGGDVADLEGLCSTSAHVVRDGHYFSTVKGVQVMTQTEAVSIDRKAKTLKIRHLTDGHESSLEYDKLVIGTGGMPVVPPFPGVDLPGVSVVTTLHHAKAIKERISKGQVENAVVIGGGAIGLEMAEALTDLWGVDTTLVEMADQLLPSALGKDMALLTQNHMEEKGVRVLLSEKVSSILGDAENGVSTVKTSKSEIPCDLVVLAAGVKPNAKIAADAGLAIGGFGGIIVDRCMRTSDPNIYAGGDCVELPHLVNGQYMPMPLGSLANRQGRVIGTNIAGGGDRFKGTVGSFCLKVFDLGVARAGLTENQARDAGFDPIHTVVVQSDRAHFYPTQELMYMKLIADRKTRRVLGIEAVGLHGDAVKARVDSVAAILQYSADLSDISNLEVAYAPPFASAMDIVNNAANSLENIIEGRQDPIDVMDFLSNFKTHRGRVLDVRSSVQSGPFVKKYGEQWLNIPQDELGKRLSEIPANELLSLVCGSGPRSYEAQLFLRDRGIRNTKNIQGGMGMIKLSDPEFAPPE
ncbi:MAG: pyridine nucleotide-disulfide oxidoreductase [Desulfobacteraceae bacterium 4572_88]|nr:MAG: pyridine nucleotide-disulfide oxidoreductase [Desulfobacteraceae bacterium 4572_88]